MNEFGEMLSEIRPGFGCRGEMLASTAACTKTNPVRLFTSHNDKRKLDETRTSRGCDYTPFPPNLPFITGVHRHKGQRRGREQVAVRLKAVCARPY